MAWTIHAKIEKELLSEPMPDLPRARSVQLKGKENGFNPFIVYTNPNPPLKFNTQEWDDFMRTL